MFDKSDRHAWFDTVRPERPAYRDPAGGSILLTRMTDGRAWLADPAQWKDADRAEEGAVVRRFKPADMNRPGDRNSGIGWMDEPDHSRVRQPIQEALMRRVASMKGEVEAIVNARVDALPEGCFDVVADYALPIPIAVIARVLGVEVADYAQFRAWSEAALNSFNPAPTEAETRATKTAAEAMLNYFDRAISARRGAPRDDLVSDLLAVQRERGRLSDSEIRVNCMNLLLGGNVTTADLIASGVWLLLTHPGQLAVLRAEPALIGSAVEEILRYEPPGDGAQRVAARDIEIAGCPIRAHEVAVVVIPAANRDPAIFTDPHRFDIARRNGPHISFGAGAHICIGAALARLEAKAAIWGLLERYPDLRLADPMSKPRWRPDPFFRGLATLPVTV